MKLIPELRFPEFEGDGEWVEKKLGEVYNFLVTNSFSRANLNYEDGEVKNIHYGDIHTKFSTLFDITREDVPFINPDVSIEKIREECYCLEGDIIFADASEDSNDVGKSIEIVNINGEKLVSGLHTLMARQINKTLKIGFGGYLFKSDWVRKQIQREAQGAKVLGISTGRISTIKISFPRNPQEQQKIASCLSSLDELIAAHSDKLHALKDHKKGLLQNLFPQEGETVPKVRFSEFEGDGEWVEKKLGDKEVSSFVNDKVDSEKLTLENYISTDNMLPDYSGITKASKLPTTGRVTEFLEGDILISNIRPYLKKVWKANKNGGASNDVLVFRSGSKILNNFLEFILKNDTFINYVMQSAKGVKMPRGDKDSMMEYSVSIPSKKEQQKIASCLLTVDELITAQQEKIAQLQQHKKGLMQGLFPKMV